MRSCSLVVTIGLCAATASAQTSPKPPAELDAMAKLMLGTWACDSTVKLGKTNEKYALKITWTRELGGFWLVGRSEATVQGMKLETVSYLGYDAASKTWTQMAVDNQGSVVSLTAKGTPEKLEFTGKARSMGQDFSPTMTMVKKSDKEVVLATSATMGGQTMSEEMVCKK
jgi:hypothetical protein